MASNQRPIGEADSAVDATRPNEASLVEALRRGDEAAFVALVERYHRSMLQVARLYVRDDGAAEDVVQESWVGVLNGLDRFEGRSSFKAWVFRILTNRAKTRAVRDARTVPFARLTGADADDDEPSVDPSRFMPADHPNWPGHWQSPPRSWGENPEDRLLRTEGHAAIREAIAALPENQRTVITLRDVKGWTSEETCAILGLSDANHRVLLHRARSRVRRALERYFDR